MMTLYKFGKIVSDVEKTYNKLDNDINNFENTIKSLDPMKHKDLIFDLMKISNNISFINNDLKNNLKILNKVLESLDKELTKMIRRYWWEYLLFCYLLFL